MACETRKIRARIMSQHRETSHGRDSKMWGFQSQEGRHAGECSTPDLPVGTCRWEPWIPPSLGRAGKKA